MRLSPKLDVPVMGEATNAAVEGVFPFVDYEAWKTHVGGMKEDSRWEAYFQLLSNPVVLGSRITDREKFWCDVALGKHVVFEHLAPAILGVGNLPYLDPVPVYNEFAVLNLLYETMEPADADDAGVMAFYNTSVKNLNFGDRTPWFVRPYKISK